MDCPGSWRPVPYIQVGDVFLCDFCGRKVGVTVPPPDDIDIDPWAGSKDPRVAVHWFVSKPPPQ
jgi:hypothetical protein